MWFILLHISNYSIVKIHNNVTWTSRLYQWKTEGWWSFSCSSQLYPAQIYDKRKFFSEYLFQIHSNSWYYSVCIYADWNCNNSMRYTLLEEYIQRNGIRVDKDWQREKVKSWSDWGNKWVQVCWDSAKQKKMNVTSECIWEQIQHGNSIYFA